VRQVEFLAEDGQKPPLAQEAEVCGGKVIFVAGFDCERQLAGPFFYGCKEIIELF
jgi:hypothetical protein